MIGRKVNNYPAYELIFEYGLKLEIRESYSILYFKDGTNKLLITRNIDKYVEALKELENFPDKTCFYNTDEMLRIIREI